MWSKKKLLLSCTILVSLSACSSFEIPGKDLFTGNNDKIALSGRRQPEMNRGTAMNAIPMMPPAPMMSPDNQMAGGMPPLPPMPGGGMPPEPPMYMPPYPPMAMAAPMPAPSAPMMMAQDPSLPTDRRPPSYNMQIAGMMPPVAAAPMPMPLPEPQQQFAAVPPPPLPPMTPAQQQYAYIPPPPMPEQFSQAAPQLPPPPVTAPQEQMAALPPMPPMPEPDTQQFTSIEGLPWAPAKTTEPTNTAEVEKPKKLAKTKEKKKDKELAKDQAPAQIPQTQEANILDNLPPAQGYIKPLDNKSSYPNLAGVPTKPTIAPDRHKIEDLKADLARAEASRIQNPELPPIRELPKENPPIAAIPPAPEPLPSIEPPVRIARDQERIIMAAPQIAEVPTTYTDATSLKPIAREIAPTLHDSRYVGYRKSNTKGNRHLASSDGI